MELRVQDADALALADRLVGLAGQITVSPAVGLITGDSDMVPAKLLRLVSLTATEAPVAPELKSTGVPTLTVKSATWTVVLAE